MYMLLLKTHSSSLVQTFLHPFFLSFFFFSFLFFFHFTTTTLYPRASQQKCSSSRSIPSQFPIRISSLGYSVCQIMGILKNVLFADIYHYSSDNPSYDLSKPVFVDYSDPTQYVSGLQLRSLAKRLANGLRIRAKVTEGDVVFLSSTNTVCKTILTSAPYHFLIHM